jgi:hypothetical protein
MNRILKYFAANNLRQKNRSHFIESKVSKEFWNAGFLLDDGAAKTILKPFLSHYLVTHVCAKNSRQMKISCPQLESLSKACEEALMQLWAAPESSVGDSMAHHGRQSPQTHIQHKSPSIPWLAAGLILFARRKSL